MKNENNTLTMNILKNRYGNANFVQKYDVDFSINKYKPIQDFNQELTAMRQTRAKQIFTGGKPF